MKAASVIATALLGLASAADELFLSNREQNQEIQSISDIETLIKSGQTAYKLQNGLCQPMFGYQLFDLATIDGAMNLTGNQDTEELYPTSLSMLQFNLCNQGINLDVKNLEQMKLGTTCQNKHHAYLGNIAAARTSNTKLNEYTCQYSFAEPFATGFPDPANKKKFSGFDLKYPSNELAADKKTPAQYLTFSVRCNAEKKGKPTWALKEAGGAGGFIYEYEGEFGCPVLDVSYIKHFQDFTGTFNLILGILLIFIGSKFIIITFCLLVFVGIIAISFALAYNFGIIKIQDKNVLGYLIGTLIFGIITGGIAAVLLAKFAKHYAVPVLAGWTGATITFMVLAPTSLSSLLKMVIMLAAVGLSAYFGRKFNRQIKAFGTAIIGSGMLMYGIGTFAGGFPDLFQATEKKIEGFNDVNASYLGYFLGFLASSAVGTAFQLRFIDQKEVDEDDMLKMEDQ